MKTKHRIGPLVIDDSLEATVGDSTESKYACFRSARLTDLQRALFQVRTELETRCPDLMEKMDLLDRAIGVKINHLMEYHEAI